MLSGFIGSGGAFVLTPGMMSIGVQGPIAVASNMCHKFPKAMIGAYRRHKIKQLDPKLAALFAISAIAGVQIGIREKYLNCWDLLGQISMLAAHSLSFYQLCLTFFFVMS